MWIVPIPFIFIFIVSFSGVKSDFLKLLRTTREISFEKFNALCYNIGCRSPGGSCDYNAFRLEGKILCSCNKNYTGDLCQHRCSIDCGEHGKCAVFGPKEVCLCSEGYTGVNCSIKETDIRLDHGMKESNPVSHNALHADRGNGCSPVIMKQNFPCNLNNGVCVKNTTDFGFMYSCVCKEGWTGTFCDVPCNKTCLNGGYCHVMSSGRQYCLCNWNTFGEFCEKPQPGQLFIQERFTQKKSTNALIRKPSAGTKPMVTIKKGKGIKSKHFVKRSTRFGQSCKPFCGYNSEKCSRIEIELPYGLQTYYICNCKAGWTGPMCEKMCTLPCQNGGRCVLNHGQEICSCSQEFGGHLCEVPATILG